MEDHFSPRPKTVDNWPKHGKHGERISALFSTTIRCFGHDLDFASSAVFSLLMQRPANTKVTMAITPPCRDARPKAAGAGVPEENFKTELH